jgi:hypothetical protein
LNNWINISQLLINFLLSMRKTIFLHWMSSKAGKKIWKKKRIHHMCFQIRYLGMVKKNTYYVCNRSGFYKLNLQKPERQRALKLRGANKINASCPALLKIVAENEGRISVNYIQTRVGHDFEIGKLRLTASERQELAGEQLQGIQNHRILKDISKKFNADKKVSYTTIS